MRNLRRHAELLVCAFISVSVLTLFFIFQHRGSQLLKLESKWLIVAGIPILIGLIVGNYVKTFKGFGIELEALLQVSIGKIELKADEAASVVLGDEKRSISYLNSLSNLQIRKIQRLTFTVSKPNYYLVWAVLEYLNKLTQLKYVEIVDSQKRFQSLLSVQHLKSQKTPDEGKVRDFISALETNTLDNSFGNHLIANFVRGNEPLLDVLKKIRINPSDELPVVSPDGLLIGVVTERLIEKKIADEVIAMQKRTA